jgi:hypothetical protein
VSPTPQRLGQALVVVQANYLDWRHDEVTLPKRQYEAALKGDPQAIRGVCRKVRESFRIKYGRDCNFIAWDRLQLRLVREFTVNPTPAKGTLKAKAAKPSSTSKAAPRAVQGSFFPS